MIEPRAARRASRRPSLLHRLRIGMCGFGEHPWRSVDRTRRFYLDALAPEMELRFADDPAALRDVDAVLSFAGEPAWRAVAGADVPYLFAVHGGATVEHATLRGHADR